MNFLALYIFDCKIISFNSENEKISLYCIEFKKKKKPFRKFEDTL
jgi:hypothetical protein